MTNIGGKLRALLKVLRSLPQRMTASPKMVPDAGVVVDVAQLMSNLGRFVLPVRRVNGGSAPMQEKRNCANRQCDDHHALNVAHA